MTFREIDNQLNRINKRLVSVSANLGKRSSLYNHYAAVVSNAVRKFGLLKTAPTGDGVETSIRRTKTIMDLPPEELEKLKKALDHIEELINKRKLKDELKRLKEIADKIRKDEGEPPVDKKMTKKEYQQADLNATNLGSRVENALDYFYTYVAEDDPLYVKAMDIMHIDGRKKTYDELLTVIGYAKEHYKKSGMPPELGAHYDL